MVLEIAPDNVDEPTNSSNSNGDTEAVANGVSSLEQATTSTDSSSTSSEIKNGSHNLQYPTAPPVPKKYDPKNALDDLPGVHHALELFLASHMHESEEFCHKNDKKKERMYFATGYGLIQCVKALMSYADEDILSGIEHTKHGNVIASQHRKKQAFIASRLAGYVVTSLNTTGVGFVKTMTDVERHAELTFAESLFEKALLGIIYSGDWLAFLKEALNMRTLINIYRQLYRYIQTVDEEYKDGPQDPSVDEHFRSGVYLGMGLSTLILSLLPGKLLSIVEIFGWRGDRQEALEILARAGGWTKESDEPSISSADEGVRRSICDMGLLIFHLVLSSFTFEGVDLTMARKIINWNLKRYPNGVFFIFGAGRLSLAQSQPQKAIEYYTRAMEVQKQYRNLHHISFWEIALANLSLWDLEASLVCWRDLEREATWSKAIYSYGMAICLLDGPQTKEAKEEAIKILALVPERRQKIAGKSIPVEKLVARKARKFAKQGNRLALPALEFSYLFQGITHAPRKVIIEKILPEVDKLLHKLKEHEDSIEEYENGHGYWDDFCLAKLMEGVCLRYVAYPDADAVVDPTEAVPIPTREAEERAVKAFEAIFEHGPKIELDHYLVYHAHYEIGRLYACQDKKDLAKAQFDLIISGKYLEVGPSGKKGKYSLENALTMRTNAALDALDKRKL